MRGVLLVAGALCSLCAVPRRASGGEAGGYCVIVSQGQDASGKLYATVSSVVKLPRSQSKANAVAGYGKLLRAIFPKNHARLGTPVCDAVFSTPTAAGKLREMLMKGYRKEGYVLELVAYSGNAERDIQAFHVARAWKKATSQHTEESYKSFLAAFQQSRYASEARQRYERLRTEREALEKRQREEAAWRTAQAGDTIASYKAFLAAHGTSSFAEAARTKLRVLEEAARQREDAAWAAAQKTDTVSAYKTFIAVYSQSRYLAEASKKLRAAEAAWRKKATAAFAAAKTRNTVAAYTAFLTSYPDAPQAGDARNLLEQAKKRESEDNAWANAQAQKTVASYRAFLAAHPQSRYLTQARAKLADAEATLRRTQQAAFEKAKSVGTEEAYSQFLTNHPEGAHTVEARNLLGELQAARRRREEEAWSKAKAANTAEGYSVFLRAHPQSSHAPDARGRKLSAQTRERLARLRSSIAGRWRTVGAELPRHLTIYQRGARVRMCDAPGHPASWSLSGTFARGKVAARRVEAVYEGTRDVRVEGTLSSDGMKLTFRCPVGASRPKDCMYRLPAIGPAYVREDPNTDPSKFVDVATAGSPLREPKRPARRSEPPAQISGPWRLSATLFQSRKLGGKTWSSTRDFPTAIQQRGARVSLLWSDGMCEGSLTSGTASEAMRGGVTLCGTYSDGRLTAITYRGARRKGDALEINGWVSDDGQSITGRYLWTSWHKGAPGLSVFKYRGVFAMVRAARTVQTEAYDNVAIPTSPKPPIPRIARVDGIPCFIATAAYGSAWEPEVATLRRFRDRWLVTHASGRLLVDTYYRCSPPLAAAIADRSWARRVTRILLAPIVVTAGATLGEPADICTVAGTFLLTAALWRLWRCRRNQRSVPRPE